MPPFKFKTLRTNVHVSAVFDRPILDWRDVPARFCSLIYDALSGKLSIKSSEISFNPANVLGEIRGKYSVFGGSTSVSLGTDRLVFDFPNLAPADAPVAGEVMKSIHDAFPLAFPEINYGQMEVQLHEHIDLFEQNSVDSFLERYKVVGADSAFGTSVVVRPAVKMGVVSPDRKWQCDFAAEHSLFSVTALFLAANISLRDVSPTTPFLDKARTVSELTKSWRALMQLEDVDAPST